ncbi:MAG: FxDxF family PEP-CTERM protein [Rhodocyclaceae bacterium]|nr:FxDxF family PEP-CTERM protein [Rhodocyclaceae bacterium]
MNKKPLVVALAAAVWSAAGLAATSYSDGFPSPSSSVTASVGHSGPNVEYFWSSALGHQVSQTYAGTGVFNAVSLELNILVSKNVLHAGNSVQWDVFVNGIDVGDWAWKDTDGTGYMHQTYGFAPIAGDTYTILMAVKNVVPDGDGSIALNYDSTMTIAAVPEPETYAMMLAGLGLLGAAARRRARAA